MNESVVRLGVFKGEFHFHKHDREDDFFYVVSGRLSVELESCVVELGPNEGVMVPHGVVHRTRAPQRTVVLMVEGATVKPTGDSSGGPIARFARVNLIAADWRKLSRFYVDVFGCVAVGPERKLAGDEIERATGIPGAEVSGAHLRLPGCGEGEPTLEVFQYDPAGSDVH